jgi:4-amino-4-deoxy-L-arabinose transferase-like glycosyltransferase
MDLLDTRRPRALLLAFCLLVWLPGFFTLPPTDRDESRFAQATKQMIQTGDYVRIMNGTEPRNRKPIGIYWLQAPFAAAAQGLGLATADPVWPYRIPSLLGGLIAVLATFEIGRALGDRRAALLAAGMLGACVILTVETHMAKTDAALLGATTVAMAVLGRAYFGQGLGRGGAALFWIAMGAGVLLKGPITPMVAALTAAALCVTERRARWLLALRPWTGLAILLLMVLPWFVAIGLATHGQFFADAVGGDLGRKLASGDDAHGAPPGIHLLLLPLIAFPSTLSLLRSLPQWWVRRREPASRFLLAWVVPSWIVFEAVPTKLPHYTLPLLPAVFLLAARLVPDANAGRWGRVVSPAITLAVAALLAGGAAALPIAAGASFLLGIPAAIAIAIAGWLVVQPGRPLLALAAMPVITAALLGFELPHIGPLWLANRVEAALARTGFAGKPLAAVGYHEPSLMFLVGAATIMARTGQDGADDLARHEAAAALVAEGDRNAFLGEAARLGLTVQPVAGVRGFNYSRGRAADLTLYAPASR